MHATCWSIACMFCWRTLSLQLMRIDCCVCMLEQMLQQKCLLHVRSALLTRPQLHKSSVKVSVGIALHHCLHDLACVQGNLRQNFLRLRSHKMQVNSSHLSSVNFANHREVHSTQRTHDASLLKKLFARKHACADASSSFFASDIVCREILLETFLHIVSPINWRNSLLACREILPYLFKNFSVFAWLHASYDKGKACSQVSSCVQWRCFMFCSRCEELSSQDFQTRSLFWRKLKSWRTN